MDQHPIQGRVEILLVASCYRNRDKLRPDGPQLARMQTFAYHFLLQCAILDRSTRESRQRKRRDEAPEFIAVPGNLMGFVIGRNGTSVKEIEVESGAKLNSDRDQRGFVVSGNKEQRARARELVEQKVVSANLGVLLGVNTCAGFFVL